MGVGSSVSGWASEEACRGAVKGTALFRRAVGYATEQDMLDAPPVSTLKTFATSDCSGTALLTKAYDGSPDEEHVQSAIADACGSSGGAYYTSTMGAAGGTETACTRCPPVTAVYTYSDKQPYVTPVCSKIASAKYYYGTLSKYEPGSPLSADVACDPANSRAYAAKVFNGSGGSDLGCTACPSRSIITAYPHEGCWKPYFQGPGSPKDLRIAELSKKGAYPLTQSDVFDLQDTRIYKEPQMWEKLKARAGLTEDEARELIRLAVDVADESEYPRENQATFDVDRSTITLAEAHGAKPQEAVDAYGAVCAQTYPQLLNKYAWKAADPELAQFRLRDAQYKPEAFRSISVSKGTWLGEQESCLNWCER
eukprot:tig00000571_g2167.t1